jgi:hypothetical protein
MDAYEMSDELLRDNTQLTVKAAYMLRQQADRIAELEKETHSINYTCPNCETHVELFYKTPQIKELSDRELVVFLMDEIDRASEWLVDGETHMAIGVLGQCHAKIRKHLNNTKES